MKNWPRLDGVDLLRGLAIVFVLMNHINMQLLFAHVPYAKGWPRQLHYTVAWNGQFGVQIFFAVSGFLITSTSLRRWGPLHRISMGDFYKIRFARIAPLLLGLLAILSALHLAGVNKFVVHKTTGGLPRALLAALTFHINLLEARRGYLPGNWDILWSLSVEEMFYLAFPLVCRFVRNSKVLVALLLVFVVLGPFARTVLTHGNEVWEEYSYLGGMDAIALGCLTALLTARMQLSAKSRASLLLAGSAMVVFILGFSLEAYKWKLHHTGLDMSVIALGACMMIAFFAQRPWRAPVWLSPLLVLGRRSYEVYLTHMFVVIAGFALFAKLGNPMHAAPAVFLVIIAAAGLLGELVARFYSEPANRSLRRWMGEDRLGTTIPEKT